MADSASSVASFDFCGIFAISVVASSLRRTCRRGPNRHDRWKAEACHERGTVRPQSRKLPVYRPIVILSPWQCERNHAVKDFFIIVNRLLTIANAVHRPSPVRPRLLVWAAKRPIGRYKFNLWLGDYSALTTVAIGQ